MPAALLTPVEANLPNFPAIVYGRFALPLIVQFTFAVYSVDLGLGGMLKVHV